jgi:hypothetical protein
VAEALASQDWEADRELERVTSKTDALGNDVRDYLQFSHSIANQLS